MNARACVIFRVARPDRGFTVLELLVTLIILALIISFIPGTLGLGQRVWEIDSAANRRAGFAAFMHTVEQRLASAAPLFERGRDGLLEMEFRGEPGRMMFVAEAAAGLGGGGLYRFDLSRADGDGPQPLQLIQTLYRPERGGGPQTTADATLTHITPEPVAEFSLRYFGRPDAESAPVWQSRWKSPSRLPDLVEMTVARGDPVRRETTVVRLRLGAAP